MAIGKGQIEFTIAEDGLIRMETGDMAGAMHKQADDLLATIQRLAGGEVTREKAAHGHAHSHSHDHDHSHDHNHDTHKH